MTAREVANAYLRWFAADADVRRRESTRFARTQAHRDAQRRAAKAKEAWERAQARLDALRDEVTP